MNNSNKELVHLHIIANVLRIIQHETHLTFVEKVSRYLSRFYWDVSHNYVIIDVVLRSYRDYYHCFWYYIIIMTMDCIVRRIRYRFTPPGKCFGSSVTSASTSSESCQSRRDHTHLERQISQIWDRPMQSLNAAFDNLAVKCDVHYARRTMSNWRDCPDKRVIIDLCLTWLGISSAYLSLSIYLYHSYRCISM